MDRALARRIDFHIGASILVIRRTNERVAPTGHYEIDGAYVYVQVRRADGTHRLIEINFLTIPI